MKAKRQTPIPGLFVPEALSDGVMTPVPQISIGCKESNH
jgi:hypothetical protein